MNEADPPGTYIEQRLLGMLMAQPQRAAEYPDLDKLMIWEDHQRAFRVIRDLKNTDLLILADHVTPDLLAYLHELALEESFAPENFPGYVRALKEIESDRSYKASIGRARPNGRHRHEANPFASI